MRPTIAWIRGLSSLLLVGLLAVGGGAGCGRDEPRPPGSTSNGPQAAPPAAREGTASTPAGSGRSARASATVTLHPTSQSAGRADAAPPPPPEGSTTRWYEIRREGQKLGWIRVVWAPSTWQGKPTVHDTTTVRTREARQMLGMEDVFENESVTDVERGEDGTLWWMRTVTRENGGRTSTAETTWTGDGYDHVERLNGQEERRRVNASAPAHVDAEAFLGSRVAAHAVKTGDRFVLRVLDVRAEKIVENPVEVLGPEAGPGEAGDVPCTKLLQRDPDTGGETLFWIDERGAFARVKDLSSETVRVPEGKALDRPVRPASFSITSPARPPLARVFSAERLLVDVYVRPDPDRPLPEFPESPWSRVVGVDGDAQKGWVVHTEMRAYDAPEAKATIPVTDPRFAKDLEPTLLMPCLHPDVLAAARRAVGDEKDARKAAQRIADFVYTLEKQSPEVAQATAVEILSEMKGDCSEHALLFVALCRAAGIPARRCSGFVCVGSDWGAHAWAEIWVGQWIGADPTTDDVGTAARYLFYGYDDAPSSRLGTVSARARGRLRLVTRHLDEGDDHVDFGDPATWLVQDAKARTARHLLAGLDFRRIPPEWQVTLSGDGEALVRLPDRDGLVTVRAVADQGQRSTEHLREIVGDGEPTTFAGARAVRAEHGGRRVLVVASRKRLVIVDMRVRRERMDAVQAALEDVMASTFTDRPKAP